MELKIKLTLLYLNFLLNISRILNYQLLLVIEVNRSIKLIFILKQFYE